MLPLSNKDRNCLSFNKKFILFSGVNIYIHTYILHTLKYIVMLANSVCKRLYSKRVAASVTLASKRCYIKPAYDLAKRIMPKISATEAAALNAGTGITYIHTYMHTHTHVHAYTHVHTNIYTTNCIQCTNVKYIHTRIYLKKLDLMEICSLDHHH